MTKKNLMFYVPALFAVVAAAPFSGCFAANAADGNDECAAATPVPAEEKKACAEPLRLVRDDAAGKRRLPRRLLP